MLSKISKEYVHSLVFQPKKHQKQSSAAYILFIIIVTSMIVIFSVEYIGLTPKEKFQINPKIESQMNSSKKLERLIRITPKAINLDSTIKEEKRDKIMEILAGSVDSSQEIHHHEP